MEIKTVNPWSHMLESCKKHGVGGITYKKKKVSELTAEESLQLIGDMFCELMMFKGGITYKKKKVSELTAEESLTLIGDMFCELMVFKAEAHDREIKGALAKKPEA